jgi:hypothetical protein
MFHAPFHDGFAAGRNKVAIQKLPALADEG